MSALAARRAELGITQAEVLMQIRNARGKPQKLTNLYFVQAGADGPIKIGVAQRPAQRMEHLQTAHYEQLHLLAYVRVEALEERFYHELLEPFRLRGEWFAPDPCVLELVAAAKTVMEEAE